MFKWNRGLGEELLRFLLFHVQGEYTLHSSDTEMYVVCLHVYIDWLSVR